ncbi:MAG: hypothetical protein ACTSSE_08530 [Candidatus Thorarchaeota archaeon]
MVPGKKDHGKKHPINSIKDHKPVAGTTPGNIVIIDVNGLPVEDSLTSLASILGGINIQGAWNATTNVPDLTLPGAKVAGHGYIVTVAGNTNLDGITDWKVKDIAWFDGIASVWRKIDNTQDIHALGGSLHSADLLANLNSKVSDTDVIGADGSVPFTADQSMGGNNLTSLVDYDLDAIFLGNASGGLKSNKLYNHAVNRTIGAGNNQTEIGNFAGDNHSIIVSISGPNPEASKIYIINAKSNATGGAWMIARPIYEVGALIELHVNIDATHMYLRLMPAISYATPDPTLIHILNFGGSTFTATSGTGSVLTPPTAYYGSITADSIENTPAGTIASTDVQAAINELDTEKATPADITTDIATHAGLPSVHHAKYLDSEAVSAMGAKADGNPLNHNRPIQATELVIGIAEIATQAETDAGTDDEKIVTPLKLSATPKAPTVIQDSESAVDSTTSTTFQLARRFTKTFELAKYKIEYSFELISTGTANVSCEARVLLGGSELALTNWEMNNYNVCSGFVIVNPLAGSHNIDFEFRRNGSPSGTVSIRRKRLIITKVVE